MTRIIISILLLTHVTPGIKLWSQADISMTTHWYNRAGYNPAFIARTEYFYAFINARNQWTGVEGAPNVINLQVSEYFHNIRSAFGLSFTGDKVGLTRAANPMLSYAFRIAKDPDWSLSLGLSGGVFVRSTDGSRFDAEIASDPSLYNDQEKLVRPDFNAGAEFMNEHFIVGISSTHLLSIGKSDNLFLNANHRYGYAMYKNNNLNLMFYKMGVLVVNRNNLTVLEGNVSVRFKHPTGLMKGPREIFDLGMSYRSSRQMAFLAGILISPDLRIGYAYDHSFAGGYNPNGTHEVMIEYRIPSKVASTRIRCGNELFWYP